MAKTANGPRRGSVSQPQIREVLRQLLQLGLACEEIERRGGAGAGGISGGDAEYERHLASTMEKLAEFTRTEVVERKITRVGPHVITQEDLFDVVGELTAVLKAGSKATIDELVPQLADVLDRTPRLARLRREGDPGSTREEVERKAKAAVERYAKDRKKSKTWQHEEHGGPAELASAIANSLGLRATATRRAAKLAKEQGLHSPRELQARAAGILRGKRDLVPFAAAVVGCNPRQAEQLLHDLNKPARERSERLGKPFIMD